MNDEQTTPEVLDIESEQAVLGSILAEPDLIVQAAELLSAEDFYREPHQAIFRALVQLHQQGIPADHITIGAQFKRNGELGQGALLEYIETLCEKVPSDGSLDHYAEMVKESALRRKLIHLANDMAIRAKDFRQDPRDVLSTVFDAAARDGAHGSDKPKMVGDLIPNYFDNLPDYTERMDKLRWRTCLPTLDNNWDMGMPRLVVVKARRGSGKTHILIDWAYHCTQRGRAAVIFSLEMSETGILQRVLSRAGHVNNRTIERPRSDNDWDAVTYAGSQAQGLKIYIAAGRGTNTARMQTILDGMKARGVDVGMIGIDYAELIGCKARNSREQELMGIAVDLQRMADRAQATVVLLSQTNKEGGERYSEGIGNSADLLLHWERTGELATMTCEKSRFGPGFKFPCAINLATSEIREQTTDEPEY